MRDRYTAEPAVVRQALWNVLAESGYATVSLSDWSWRASRGSAGRNVLLGGFAQRMDFRFDLYAESASGSILDGGVSDAATSFLMGGAVGAKKASDELTAIFADLRTRLS